MYNVYAVYFISLPHSQCLCETHTHTHTHSILKVTLPRSCSHSTEPTTSRKQHRGATEVVQIVATMFSVASC